MSTSVADVRGLNTIKELRQRGFAMRDAPINFLCYDPAGDGEDNDALLVVSREEWRKGELWDPDLAMDYVFRILFAQYLPTGLGFAEKQAHVLRLHKAMREWQAAGKQQSHFVCVEANGVGWAAASDLAGKIGAKVLPYSTIGNAGEKSYAEGRLSFPRLAMLDNLRTYFELEKLKAVAGAPGVANLINELNSFVWARPGRPEALKGQRDDMVMALAGGLWCGTKVVPPVTKAVDYRKMAAGSTRVH